MDEEFILSEVEGNPSGSTASNTVYYRQEKGGLMKTYSLWATFFLRVSIGWLLLYSGYEKLSSNFSAAGYLSHLQGPFSSFFTFLAGNPIVDALVVSGEILIGICLILGVLVRLASFWGIVMMLLFYFSGYPYEHSFIVDDHIIYSLVLFYLMVSNSGHFIGFDKALEKRLPNFKKLMG